MTALEPLTSRQRRIFLALTIAVALTRLLALSHSIWDWDEALFCMALHDYDVSAHHPHPPGFPTFIFLARVFRFFMTKDFHALRAVSVLAAMSLFPALFALARELRYSFRAAILAALLFCFLPNVWFYGGTAFSDIAAVAVLVAAVAATLHGRESRRWYFIGSLLIGLSVTFRPQNAAMALYPWLLASWPRFRARRFDPVIAAVLSLLVAAICYGGAAAATGSWRAYKDAVDAHRKYVMAVDGWQNPGRTPPLQLIPLIAVDPYEGKRLSYVIAGFAAFALIAGAVRRDRRPFEVVLIFGPFLVMALVLLNPAAAGRLSIGYLPMHALLASLGIETATTLVTFRRARVAAWAHAIVVVAIAGYGVHFIWRGLREVRKFDSPPIEAMRWLTRNVPKKTGFIYVQGGLDPFADYLLQGWNVERVGDLPVGILDPRGGRAWYVADGMSGDAAAINFRRPRRRLWSIFLQRYFEVSIRKVTGGVMYLDGWYDEESSGDGSWRWMMERGELSLPALGKRGEVRLSFYVPLDSEPTPLVTVTVDGKPLDAFRPNVSEFERVYTIDSPLGHPLHLGLAVDRTVQPPHDPRRLGLRLNAFSWKPVNP
jgi:hypothetical protein